MIDRRRPPRPLVTERAGDFGYIVISLLFVAAGMGAVSFVQSVLEVEGDAILVAFLVVPLLLYLTLSGRVSEASLLAGVARTGVPGDRPLYVVDLTQGT